jgi:hypothetical protein
MRRLFLLFCLFSSLVAMAHPRRSFCSHHNDDTTIEDLAGLVALFSIVAEAAAEEAIDEQKEPITNEQKEILDLLQMIRVAAVEEMEEAERSRNIRRAERKLREAKRLLREAEDAFEESYYDDDDNEVAVELLKFFLKEAAKESL